jgi:hypothetical protein
LGFCFVKFTCENLPALDIVDVDYSWIKSELSFRAVSGWLTSKCPVITPGL